MNEKWLEWAMRLQSIAQAGIAYSTDIYDKERFEEIRKISVEIVSQHTDIDSRKVMDLFASDDGYQTPKIDIRSAVFKENQILLVKEKSDGFWSLPGGWADIDKSLSEAVKNECFEEAGALVNPKRIISVLLANRYNNPNFPHAIYKIFVECELVSLDFSPNIETSEASFFDIDSLPTLSVHRNTEEQVKECFRIHNCDVTETRFD